MFAEFLVVLITVLFVGLLFSAVFRTAGPWDGPIWFFLVLFLATWAVGSWMEPVGPTVWGVTWVPFVLIAFFVALLLAAATPPPETPRYRPWKRRVPARETVEQAEEEATAFAVVGIFFWVLFFVLLLFLFLNLFAVYP